MEESNWGRRGPWFAADHVSRWTQVLKQPPLPRIRVTLSPGEGIEERLAGAPHLAYLEVAYHQLLE